MSQLEADEEFARQLAQEDEALVAEQRRQRAATRQAASAASGTAAPDGVSRPLAYQPYVPRSRRGTTNSGMSALSPTISPSSTSWEPPAQADQQRDVHSPGPRGRTAQDEIQEELAEIGEQMFVPLSVFPSDKPYEPHVLIPQLRAVAPNLRNRAKRPSPACSARSRKASPRWTMRSFALRASNASFARAGISTDAD